MTSRLAAILSSLAIVTCFTSRASAGKVVDFARDIRPILANNCFTCHGPDPKTRKSALRLDIRAEAVKAARSGTAPIVPGNPSASELVKRILAEDVDQVMPPLRSNKALTARDKELLRLWITEGAEYPRHWAFVKPARHTAPVVKTPGWVRNDIDAFILARLEAAGLNPLPGADRATLVRRVSLDVRGLPPSLSEVDAFLNDSQPDAYERMVDRMFSSPQYGEKMAQIWLDLARFGDTSGYEYDSTRQMWLWRDWVINAYNSNVPFDRFTVEQLAGDLLPGATVEQKIASGFNRNTRYNEEAGSDPEEFVVRYNVDRTNTLGQVWLGLTLGCAECHSHKYDPITQKEYYQLFAFFTGIKEPSVSGNHNQPLPPLLKLPTPAQAQMAAQRKAELDAKEKEIAAELKKTPYQEPPAASSDALKPHERVWIDDDLPTNAVPQGDGSQPWQWVSAPAPVHSGKRSMRRSGPGLHQHYFTGAQPLPLRLGDKLFAHVWLDSKDPPKTVMLQWHDGVWEHRAYWGEDAGFLAGQPDAANHRKVGPLPKPGAWARLEVDPKTVGLKPNAKISGWAFTQMGGTVYYDTAGVVNRPTEVRYLISQFAWEQGDKVKERITAPVREALKIETAKRTDAQKCVLRDFYLRFVFHGTRPVLDPLNKQFDDAEKNFKEVDDAIPSVMVSEELPQRRPAYVLVRGDFQQRGDKVQPEVPAFLPPLRLPTKNAPAASNRLDLARWLVSPEHPLTARVAVNRLWAQLFGTGIVKTIGDFGTQGEPPSHPELLDWLATEFVAGGWDTKALLKKMILSATYRQSSALGVSTALPRSARATEIDPQNRLLARGPRYRLSAEEVRDNALAIAGLLSPKVGGRSVMPHQPTGFYQSKYESWKWVESSGDDQYRRGLYTFWRRTCLHPMFSIFDAPSREDCTVYRPRTNTPLQALVVLNDPTFVEAARAFAQRVLTERPTDLDSRITFAFRTALARTPTAAERAALRRQYRVLHDRYRSEPKAAAELVKAGRPSSPAKLDLTDHAAWTGLANLLLNLDETITRE